MAKRIVDVLEAIQVEKQDGHAAVLTARTHDGMSQPLGQQGPIGEAGEVVVIGEVAQLLLETLGVGDVAQYRNEMTAPVRALGHLGNFDLAEKFQIGRAPWRERVWQYV